MIKETELREVAYGWIVGLPQGTIFYSEEVYRFLEQNFPVECKQRGSTGNELRFHNDARWVVRDAKDRNIVRSTDRRAKYKRI